MKLVMIDVNTGCSAKCKYCLHQYNNMAKPRSMELSVLKKIIDILKRENYDYVYPYLSGESLLHKDYWDMLQYITNNSMYVNTATKLCFDIDFDRAKKALSSIKKGVHFDITIDSHEQIVQDKISKGIKIEQVFDNLKKLYEITIGQNISFTVVTVVNKFNENYLVDIEKRVKSCGNFRWAAKPMGYYMGYKMDTQDHKMIAEMSPNNNPRYTIRNDRLISNMKYCSMFIKPVIGPDGEVTICCHDMLYKEAKWNIIKTGSLDKIVTSEHYKNTVKLGRKMKLEICSGCN